MKFSRRKVIGIGAAGALGALGELAGIGIPLRVEAAGKNSPPSPHLPANEKGSQPLVLTVLGKATYGQTPEAIEAFNGLGSTQVAARHSFIEAQLHPQQISDAVCEHKITQLGLVSLNKDLAKLWADYFVEPNRLKDEMKDAPPKPGAPPVKMKDFNQMKIQPAMETEAATWIRAVYSQRQVHEILTEFWHDHFNIFAYDGNQAPVFAHFDREVVRKHALGNFREFLEAVAKSPAMLFYLDNFVNQSSNPNENYARELFELHTLGADNYLGTEDRSKVPGFAQKNPLGYVDGDVYEAARCLTGWRVDTGKNTGETGSFAYVDQFHDRFQKIVLGRQFPELQPPLKDGELVLDLLAEHPGTAHTICKKLCRRFVADQPSEVLIRSAAQIFIDKRKAPDQLLQVMRFILSSAEFSSGSAEQKLRRPFESAVALLRATGCEFQPSEKFLNIFNRAGQRRFGWRTPDGYPDTKEKWGNTTAWLEKWRLANQLMGGKIEGVKVQLTAISDHLSVKSPHALAEFWGNRMLGMPLSPNALKEVTDLLAQGRDPMRALPPVQIENRLGPAVALIAMSPQFQWRG